MKGFFDIHTHILPGVDDGAQTMEESLKLLKMLKDQKVSAVLATPHFYPMNCTFEDFSLEVKKAYDEILYQTKGTTLPKIYLGCELLYYCGISQVTCLSEFCLNNSNYILLELPNNSIDKSLFYDIRKIKENYNINVIIAHIERYYKNRNFKKLLEFTKENNILTQMNCSSLFLPLYKKISYKLIKNNYISVLSTDTHSIESRPPLFDKAIMAIEKKFGTEKKEKLMENSQQLYNKIILKEELNG